MNNIVQSFWVQVLRRKELLQAWGKEDCEIMVPVEGETLDDGDPVATVEAIAKKQMASLQRLKIMFMLLPIPLSMPMAVIGEAVFCGTCKRDDCFFIR
ncbi:MAG: hypothetical protein R3A45_13045 [Bdellovibrionota bacterium]